MTTFFTLCLIASGSVLVGSLVGLRGLRWQAGLTLVVVGAWVLT